MGFRVSKSLCWTPTGCAALNRLRRHTLKRLCLVFEQIIRLFFGACIIIIYLKPIFMFERMISLQFPKKKYWVCVVLYSPITKECKQPGCDKCLPYFAQIRSVNSIFFYHLLFCFYDEFSVFICDRSRCSI